MLTPFAVMSSDVYKRQRHNHLVFHLAEGELSGSGVAAVEAHKDVYKRQGVHRRTAEG